MNGPATPRVITGGTLQGLRLARLTADAVFRLQQSDRQDLSADGWTYVGAIGSQFAAGGVGQVGPIGESMPRTRSGVFAGLRDPRFTLGAEWDTRKDARETGANTLLSPRVEVDTTGRLIAGFVTAKPFQLLNARSTFPLGLIARWDRFKPNTDLPGYINTVIGGLSWDLNKKTALALDYQSRRRIPHRALQRQKYFLHLVANYSG